MPLDIAATVAAMTVPFILFAAALFWAELQTRRFHQ
jgi:hypothetical protein